MPAKRKTAAKRPIKRTVNRKKSSPKGKQKVFTDKPGQELMVKSYAGGRKVRQDLKGAWKMIRSNIVKNVYGYELVSRYLTNPGTGVPGAIVCGSSWGGATFGSGSYTYPITLHSLTAVPNMNNGAISIAPPATYLITRPSASATSVLALAGATQLQILNSVGGTNQVSSYPLQNDTLDSVNIKMVLYGVLNRPTEFRIDMVQILDPTLHPDWLTNSGSVQGPEAGASLAFYEELCKKFQYSPIAFSDPKATKGRIKYLKSWTHMFEPKLNTEYQTTDSQTTSFLCPHSRVFNIYHKFNRRSNYAWDDSGAPNVSTVAQSDNQNVVTGANKTDVTYRARIYLMVRTLSPVAQYNGVTQSNVSPSYDIACRFTHSSMD